MRSQGNSRGEESRPWEQTPSITDRLLPRSELGEEQAAVVVILELSFRGGEVCQVEKRKTSVLSKGNSVCKGISDARDNTVTWKISK